MFRLGVGPGVGLPQLGLLSVPSGKPLIRVLLGESRLCSDSGKEEQLGSRAAVGRRTGRLPSPGSLMSA